MKDNSITNDEREGIKMIQALQKLAGIDETERQALVGWRAMPDGDKQTTRDTYALIFGRGKA